MIKGNLGTVTIKNSGIIADEKFFLDTFAIKDGLKDLTAGTLMKLDADGKTLVHCDGAGNDDPIAVLYEDVAEPTKDTHALALVFGRVNKNKLTYKDGTAVTDALVEALRKNGIYATEGVN